MLVPDKGDTGPCSIDDFQKRVCGFKVEHADFVDHDAVALTDPNTGRCVLTSRSGSSERDRLCRSSTTSMRARSSRMVPSLPRRALSSVCHSLMIWSQAVLQIPVRGRQLRVQQGHPPPRRRRGVDSSQPHP